MVAIHALRLQLVGHAENGLRTVGPSLGCRSDPACLPDRASGLQTLPRNSNDAGLSNGRALSSHCLAARVNASASLIAFGHR